MWMMDTDGRNEKRLADIDTYPYPGKRFLAAYAIKST